MAKVMDITEKLGMQGKPEIVIGKTRVKVDNSAKTMLQVLAVIGDSMEFEPGKVAEIYELVFDEKARAAIDKLNLNFEDFATVVETAMELVTGSEEGNPETPDTMS